MYCKSVRILESQRFAKKRKNFTTPFEIECLWGEAGAPGGTVRRAAVRKRGSGSTSLHYPIKYG